MRWILTVTLLAYALLLLVLGGLSIVSWKMAQIEAEVATHDVSDVSADLVSPEELAKLKRQKPQSGNDTGITKLLGGIALTTAGIWQFVNLAFIRRARHRPHQRWRWVVVGYVVSAAALVLSGLAVKFFALHAVAFGLLIVAIALTYRAFRCAPKDV